MTICFIGGLVMISSVVKNIVLLLQRLYEKKKDRMFIVKRFKEGKNQEEER
jgi:hypothetical protein